MSLRTRIARTSILIIVVGAIATVEPLLRRAQRRRQARSRASRSAGGARRSSACSTSRLSVDQILATAQRAWSRRAASTRSGSPPCSARRERELDRHLAGMALVTRAGGSPRVVARVGDTHLLTDELLTGAGGVRARAGSSSTLVAFRHDRQTFDLGFGARAAWPRTATAAARSYLEVAMPATAPSSVGFALVTRGAHPRTVLGNAEHTGGSRRLEQAGLVRRPERRAPRRAKDAAPGLFGISLPTSWCSWPASH